MIKIDFPVHLRKLVRELHAMGGQIARDGGTLLFDGPPPAAGSIAALRVHADELAAHLIPSVTPEEAAMTRGLLADAGARIAYITAPEAARAPSPRFARPSPT